jgi:cytochrome c oxidase assembly protein subunit 15
VRLSGSGLSIPDWPLAEGKVIPQPELKVWIEYIHRILAGTVGLFTAGVAIAIFRSPVYRSRLGGHAWAALGVLAVQIFYGARVVLEELPVDRVVAHLLLAFLFFAILIRMILRAQDMEREEPRRGTVADARLLAVFAFVAAGAVFAQAGLGGWVTSSGSSLACPDFPTCQGLWVPKLEGQVGIHFAHRLGGYFVFLVLIWLLLAAARAPLPPRARWPLRLAGVLVSLQVALGIGNIVLGLPLAVAVAHLATALALFGTLLVANHELARL